MKSLPPVRFLLPPALLLAGCAPNATQAPAAMADVAALPAATPSGVVLHQPRAGLYSAGQPAAGDWAEIARRGIGTVINLRPAGEMGGRDEAAEVAAAGLGYIEIPIADAAALTPDNARRLHQAIGSVGGAQVLVHCASANRSGGLLALAMAVEHGMAPEDALDFGRRAGMKSTEAKVREVLDALPADVGPAPRR